jgi:hypothetical protein
MAHAQAVGGADADRKQRRATFDSAVPATVGRIHRATNGQGVANIAEARQNKRAFLNALKIRAFGEGCLKG